MTRSTAEQLLRTFENEVKHVGYETADKKPLIRVFDALKWWLSDPKRYPSNAKFKALHELEQRWQRDRRGVPTTVKKATGDGVTIPINGFDPTPTGGGALTIHVILADLRTFIPELPEKIDPPKQPVWTPRLPHTPEISDDALDRALARREALRA